MIYVTSDPHFGHKNVIEFDKRPFSSIEEMDGELIARWNSTVQETDTVHVLGDISWYKGDKLIEIISQLKGHKHLIMGNHDKMHKNKLDSLFESVKDYDEIKYQGTTFILSHYPIHFYNKHYHGGVMLYGHVHNGIEEVYTQEIAKKLQADGIPCTMYNMGCMLWNYTPVSLDTLLSIIATEKEKVGK